jgi:hypothetical protein
MFVLKYKDEDGDQVSKFRKKSELDDFISYNEGRASTSIDEKFEVISITGFEEPEVEVRLILSVMLNYSLGMVTAFSSTNLEIMPIQVSIKIPFTSDYETLSKVANDAVVKLKSEGKIKGNPNIKLIGWSEVKDYRV